MPRPPIPELPKGKGRERVGGKGLSAPDLYGDTPPDLTPLRSGEDSNS